MFFSQKFFYLTKLSVLRENNGDFSRFPGNFPVFRVVTLLPGVNFIKTSTPAFSKPGWKRLKTVLTFKTLFFGDKYWAICRVRWFYQNFYIGAVFGVQFLLPSVFHLIGPRGASQTATFLGDCFWQVRFLVCTVFSSWGCIIWNKTANPEYVDLANKLKLRQWTFTYSFGNL